MMQRIKSCFFVLILASAPAWVFAQSPFSISTEPVPAQFIQQRPVLFNGPRGEFIVAWQDYRDGLEAYYAQRFDSNGRPVGPNFPVVSNEEIAFGANGGFAVFGHHIYYNPPFEFSQGFLQIFTANSAAAVQVKVTEFGVPADYVGCPPFGSFLGAYSQGYLLADVFNSEFGIAAFDQDAVKTYAMPDSLVPGYDAVGFALASAPGGAFAFFWVAPSQEAPFQKATLFGHFFDEALNVIADSVRLTSIPADCDAAFTLRAISPTDSLYQLFYALDDTLCFLTSNQTGALTQSTQCRILPRPAEAPANAYPGPSQFGLSNTQDGGFNLFMTRNYSWRENQTWRRLNQSAKYEFDSTGHMDSAPLAQITPFGNVRNIHRVDARRSRIPLENDGDIFLYDLEELTQKDSLKLNDENSGANQRNPSIIAGPGETFLVSWSDEMGKKSRAFDANGTPLSGEVQLEFDAGVFLPTGEFVGFSTADSSGVFTLSFTLYSQQWQVVARKALAQAQRSRWWLNAKAVPIDKDSFVTLLQDSTQLRLLRISRGVGVVDDKLIAAAAARPFPIKIAKADGGAFWATWLPGEPRGVTHIQAFGANFSAVSRLISIRGIWGGQIAFAEGGRFAYITREQYATSNRGHILTIRDTTDNGKPAAVNFAPLDAYVFKLQTLDGPFFNVSWVVNNALWTQSFDASGAPASEPARVYESSLSQGLQGATAVSGASVLFAWSDAVVAGQGFDIFGKTLSASSITAVAEKTPAPAQFILRQNYPNPFNPTTTISYELPKSRRVRISVFDITGRRIRELMDVFQPAGHHTIQWDGKDGGGKKVASGVFVVRIQAGNSVQTRKMLLLK